MKNLEKQIKEAAWKQISTNHGYINVNDNSGIIKPKEFFSGIVNEMVQFAKSTEAKEYWQQGMYTEEEVYKLVEFAVISSGGTEDKSRIKDWFNHNKKQ